MIDENKLKQLYNTLQKGGYQEDYATFKTGFTGNENYANRKKVYDLLSAHGAEIGNSYERFMQLIQKPKMSEADKMRFSENASYIASQAKDVANKAKRYTQLQNQQQKKKKDFGRVDIGSKKTVAGGDANNIVKDEFAYNPATGKTGVYLTSDGQEYNDEFSADYAQRQLDKQNDAYMEEVESGDIPSIFDVHDKDGNYDLQENVGKNGTTLTDEGVLAQYNRKLQDAYARKAEIEQMLAEDKEKNGDPLLSPQFANGIYTSNERRMLNSALDQVKLEITSLETVRDKSDSVADLWKGLNNTLFTARTWDFGLNDFLLFGRLEQIRNKINKNIPLNAAEKALLKSKEGADAAAAIEEKEMNWAYRAGKISGGSAPFMVEFIATGGYSGLTQAASKAALKFAAKRGMSKIGAQILKNTGVTAAKLGASTAMATSIQALKTSADVMDRHLGTVYRDEKGDYRFGTFDDNGNLLHEGGESFGKALYKGLTAAIIENYTEMVFGANYGLKSGAANVLEKMGMKRTAAALKNFGTKGFYFTRIKPRMKKLGVDGFLEEVMEEEIGIPLNALLVGDNKYSDLLDTKQQMDIVCGIGFSVAATAAVTGGGARVAKKGMQVAKYYKWKHEVASQDAAGYSAFGNTDAGRQQWEAIRDKIDNTENKGMGDLLTSYLRQKGNMTKEQISAAVRYGVSLMKVRGYNFAKVKEAEARQTTGEAVPAEEQKQQAKDKAYVEGQVAAPEETHEIQLDQADKQKNLAELLGITEQQLSAMSDEELDGMTGQNDNLDSAIYEYQMSTTKYNGVVDAANDRIDLAAQQAGQQVDMQTDKSRGTVRTATIKATNGAEDYDVYVVSGNIAVNDDGTINVHDSDNMILYYDPTTGTIQHADASRFASLGNEVAAEDAKTAAVAAAKEKAIKEEAGIIDGVVDVGSQFTAPDIDGNEHEYEILADNGDGTYMITVDGNVDNTPRTLEELQSLKDLADRKKLEDAKNERAQLEQTRQEQAKQKPYFDYDKITYSDGNIVLVDVTDENGDTLFQGSQVFLVSDDAAKAKVVEITADGKMKSHAVDRNKVQRGAKMSVDEYLSTLPENTVQSEDETNITEEQTKSEEEQAPTTENIESTENTEAPAEEESQKQGEDESRAIKLEDGTIVPLTEDGNPDFSQLTAEQTAELYDSEFGEEAAKLLQTEVSNSKKELDKAKNMSVKGSTFLEQKASKQAKDKAVADAQSKYDNAVAIRNSYDERMLNKEMDSHEGRMRLIDRAKAKYQRLKNKEEWKDNLQELYNETIGKVLHKLYDSTGVDVFDTEPLTVEEYVSSFIAPFSLNFEGKENGNGVKQETGLERKDFAKSHILAKQGGGMTVDEFVHKLWEDRPVNLRECDTEDIRNALLELITSDMNAYDMRNVIQKNRIAQAEKAIEDEKIAAENAQFRAEQEHTPTEEGTSPVAPEQEEQNDNLPFQRQDENEELPFSIKDEEEDGKNGGMTKEQRAADIERNKVDDIPLVDAIVGKKNRKAMERIAKMMGAKIQWQYSDSLANGWYKEEVNDDGSIEKTIYLTLDSSITEGAQFIFGHEMTHEMKSVNPSAYEELKKLLIENFTQEVFDKAVDETEKRYKDAGVNYTGGREAYEEEVVADGIGEMLRDYDMVRSLSLKMSHPLLATLHDILLKLKQIFTGTALDERVENVIYGIEQAYVETAKMSAANVSTNAGSQGTRFSIREKPAPKNTKKCYKLMRLGEDGKLYPLFIDSKSPTELNTWYDADSPNLETLKELPSGVHLVDNETGEATSFEDWYNTHRYIYEKKNGSVGKMGKYPSKEAIRWAALNNCRFVYIEETKSPQKRFGDEKRKYWNLGLNGSDAVSTFSMRPGWHAATLPTMRQIGKGKEKNLRDDTFVWVEGEVSADKDYTSEAEQNPDHDMPDRIPTDGYYMKATNADKTKSQADRVGWFVSGSFKANRIMGDREARQVIDDWNANHPDLPVEYDYERESGKMFDAKTMSLEGMPKFSLKVYHGSQASFDHFDHSFMGSGEGAQAYGWGTNAKIVNHEKFSLKNVKPVRFEVGKSLNDDEKREVFSTLKDAYKENNVPYHLEESANGKEKRVYEPTANDYVVSDITGRSLRYFVTLPDGRIAHPSELYPNISKTEVEATAQKRAYLDYEVEKLIDKNVKALLDSSVDTNMSLSILNQLQDLKHETTDVGYGLNSPQSFNYKTGIFTSNSDEAIDYVVRKMRRKEDVPDAVVKAVKKAVNESHGMADNLIDVLGKHIESSKRKKFDEFLGSPDLKFSIKNEEQRKAAQKAYDWAAQNRPDKWKQYAIVDMDKPSKMPEYYEKKTLADWWRRFYNKEDRDEDGEKLREKYGNYKLFDLNKSFDEQVNDIKGKVPEKFSLKGVRPLLTVDGEPVVLQEDNGSVDLNFRTWQEEKSQVRDALLDDAGLDEDEVDAIMAQADAVSDYVKEMMGKHPRFRDYQNSEPSSRPILRNTGEYISFDYSFNCIKKDALNAVMDKLVSMGKSGHLGVTQVEAIKKILQKHKFLTPCVMCYVEGKRKVLKQSKQDEAKWNAVRAAAGLEDKLMGEPTALTDEQKAILKELSNGKGLERVENYARSGDEANGGITADSIKKIATLMLNSDMLRGNMNYEWMMSPSSFTEMYNKFGNTGLMEYLSQGQYRGKQLLEATPFSINSIPRELYLKMYSSLELKELGGLRQFSYEDARAMMFFDYYQQFLLLQGAKSPEHLYTKRPFMPEMFGMTGAMMNQSLIVDVWNGDKWHQDALGLSDKEYNQWLRDNAGFIPRGALATDNKMYEKGSMELVPAWSVESFPVDTAMENAHNKQYKGNVGNTVVAPSRNFIIWALNNNDIHMILAYHAAGSSLIMKSLTGYDLATPMDNGYHTLGTDGKAITTLEVPEIGLEIDGKTLKWNRLLRKNGYDAKKAAQVYLDYCKKNGLTPMFNYEGVVDHPNYYKLLTDFRVYDEDGNSIVQRGVKAKLPDNWKEILNKYLAQEQSESSQVSNITLDDGIMKEIDDATKYTSIEAEERNSTINLLKDIYGKNKVSVLGWKDFDNALDEALEKDKADVLRNSGGMVYGYTVDGKIILNNDVFNANTPLHEHAHIYMNVLKAFNPKLYNRGMELWKGSEAWKDAKNTLEQLGDEPNDDKIFSECIAKFTGAENEKIISEVTGITDKNWIQKAMSWLKDMWLGVRTAFSKWTKRDLDSLTDEQFGRMPLRAFYDEKERESYIKNVRALNQQKGSEVVFSLKYSDYEDALDKWKQDNGLDKDAQRPTIPVRGANESAADYMMRLNEYRRNMALWNTAPKYEGHLLESDTAKGIFNREMQRGSVLRRIALQDSMLAIRKAQEAIMKQVGADAINAAEDAYTAENRSHGKGKNELEEFNDEFMQPLREAYNKMKKLLGNSYDNVRIYMMAKHGLERNAHMAFMKALNKDFKDDVAKIKNAYEGYKNDVERLINEGDFKLGKIDFTTWKSKDNAIREKYAPSYMEYREDENGVEQDYAGLSALFDGNDFEEAAASLVKEVESKYDYDAFMLWKATQDATKKILRDSYNAGMMSEESYKYVRDMYENYIPLRGWNDTNADQVWDYIAGGRGNFNELLKEANGRKYIADDPVAYIENMAESGILINNKNWVKQHLLLLAQNHPTSLLNVSKAWYVKSVDLQGNDIWIPASPKITPDMTSKQVKDTLDKFEQAMEAKKQKGEATQQRQHLDVYYPQTNSQKREHEVRVMKNGEEYVVYVNGDPQLAQAMNNSRAHRVREQMESDEFSKVCSIVGREMAAAYTSLSPLFIPSNYFRDVTMTLASTAIREDARYNWILRKKLPLAAYSTFALLSKYKDGVLRNKVRNGSATDLETMFYDFMMNGGETGFVSSFDIEDLKKKFKNELKDMNRSAASPVKVAHAIFDSIEFLNRAIENSNRFAVYMTSIQYGRSIEEAVNNAKDVTLNFNRKGTGEHGWQQIRNLYLFVNPAVQSLQTLMSLGKKHPIKFTTVTSLWMASGVIAPLVSIAMMRIIGSMFGGDDDEKNKYKELEQKYWDFAKWDRRNNFITWIPFTDQFVKIPLAQEFRGFYGLGDMIASALMGPEKTQEGWKDYAGDMIGQLADLLPINPTGYNGNLGLSLMPNAIRPFFELAFNTDFTGKPIFKDSEFNKYDPNFTKAYVGTPDWLVRLSKMINSLGNEYPDVQQNGIDSFGSPRFNLNNPAVVDHLLSSYLGGAYTTGSKILGLLTKALNDPTEIKIADIPVFSRFVSNPDDRPVSSKQGDDYWITKENHDRAGNALRKLKKKATEDGDFSLLENFFNSTEYKQYKADDAKVKKYDEEKKKEKAEEAGEEYIPHKLNAGDVYKAHTSPKDEFEDMKMSVLYNKMKDFKEAYDQLYKYAPDQSDGYYKEHKTAIDAINDVKKDKEKISSLKKRFLKDGKDNYDAEDMNDIRYYRANVLKVLEAADKAIRKEKEEKK